MGAAGGACWPVEWHPAWLPHPGGFVSPWHPSSTPNTHTDWSPDLLQHQSPHTPVTDNPHLLSHHIKVGKKTERWSKRQTKSEKGCHWRHAARELEALSPLLIDYRSCRQPLPWHHPISPNVSGDVGADILRLRGETGRWTHCIVQIRGSLCILSAPLSFHQEKRTFVFVTILQQQWKDSQKCRSLIDELMKQHIVCFFCMRPSRAQQLVDNFCDNNSQWYWYW